MTTPQDTRNDDGHTHASPFDALNYRQQQFTEAFAASGNGSQAVIAAGYDSSQARSRAVELLANPNVAAAIRERTAARLAALGFEADRVILELASIGFADIRDVLEVRDGEVTIKDSTEWSDTAAASVASVTVTEFKGKVTTTLKLHSKVEALDKLAKRLNLYREHQEATGAGMAQANYLALLATLRAAATAEREARQALPSPETAARAIYIEATAIPEARTTPPDATDGPASETAGAG